MRALRRDGCSRRAMDLAPKVTLLSCMHCTSCAMTGVTSPRMHPDRQHNLDCRAQYSSSRLNLAGDVELHPPILQSPGQSVLHCDWHFIADCIAGSAALGGAAVQALQLPEQFLKLPCLARQRAERWALQRGVTSPGEAPQPAQPADPAQQTSTEGALSRDEDDDDDVIYVMCTSGSTGRAKAVQGTASGTLCTPYTET